MAGSSWLVPAIQGRRRKGETADNGGGCRLRS